MLSKMTALPIHMFLGRPLTACCAVPLLDSRFEQGPHQHSLIIAGRHDKGRVDAIVRLFGGLCYFIQLSDHYAGADFFDTLAYDAYRSEANGILQSHLDAEILETEDVAMSGETLWDDLAALGQRFCHFLETEIRSKMERARAAGGKDSGKNSHS